MIPRAWPSTSTTSSSSWRLWTRGAALRDLVLERRVGAEQQLLAGLPAAVEGALDEHAAERAGREHPAVLAVERHALRDGLVDDVGRGLGEPPDVRLAGAEVAALHRVDEQAPDRVTLVGVVLGRVDPALGGDRVGAPGRVLEAEGLDPVALGGERRGGAGAGEPGADDDDRVVGALARPDEPVLVEPVLPALLDRALGDAGVELEAISDALPWRPAAGRLGSGRTPVKNASGTSANPMATPEREHLRGAAEGRVAVRLVGAPGLDHAPQRVPAGGARAGPRRRRRSPPATTPGRRRRGWRRRSRRIAGRVDRPRRELEDVEDDEGEQQPAAERASSARRASVAARAPRDRPAGRAARLRRVSWTIADDVQHEGQEQDRPHQPEHAPRGGSRARRRSAATRRSRRSRRRRRRRCPGRP